ncbi:hypothetical protein SAMN06265375_103131 [Muriicola jejuensis]|uniref:DUF7467 domain-containing protein n=1 Tax=Muriicola jejuensis TaxID=504488 RepID=A0A6P0UE29_9FLAO|nr:hypothetical protein [Muriicola jejuensis]NER11504.1 hypothetical protein [Muriicola jejuensis]SMP20270.1 hypothetical protein SAMN06265375_103131 [Muriicola jejuensis]
MKKVTLCLIGLIFMFSCQVDEIDQIQENLNAVYSRANKNENNSKKEFFYICHKLNIGNDWKFINLYLPENAIQAHLNHGDALGECPENDPDVDNGYNDCNCNGNVTRFDIRYNGARDAVISVTDSGGRKVIFKQTLTPGEMFTLNGFEKDGTLGAEIHLSVDGQQNTTIDASCTEPNMLGFTYGDFTIEGGSSLNGGEFCSGLVM